MRYGGYTFIHRQAPTKMKNPPSASRSQNTYNRYGYGTGNTKSVPTVADNYSSEARQAPTSNDTAYVFPWDETTGCFEIVRHFQAPAAEGRVTEHMLNALFREIHSLTLFAPERCDLTITFGVLTLLFSLLMGFTYLFWGALTTYLKYEIRQDDQKCFIEREPASNRAVEYAVVALVVIFFGAGLGIFYICKGRTREANRIKRRAFVIKKILERHQSTTFAATGCSVRAQTLQPS